MVKKVILPYINPNVSEALKGEVELKLIQFPRELGEDHPFKFEQCEEAYKKFGIAKAAVDKHIDFIMSQGIIVKSKVKRAETIIRAFLDDNNFDQILRSWILEALIKGNGFLEIALDKTDSKFRIINANQMYIKRNNKGEVESFNQYVGGFDRFNLRKVITFSPDEIAHLPLDIVGDCPYGFGMIYPGLYVIDNLLKSEKDMHFLINRKANAPIHVKIGDDNNPATQQDVSDFGQRLVYLNNQHEWATDHRVEMKVIDFGNLAEKFATVLEHDTNMLYHTFQVPAVLLGSPYQNEGIAMVQIDAFERRIQSIQAAIERVIEDQIFTPLLKLNGLDAHVEIEWNLPSEESINQRVTQLTTLLGNFNISPQLKARLEIDLAEKLGYEDLANKLPKPEQVPKAERDEEGNLKQPQVPGDIPGAREKLAEYIKKVKGEFCVFSHQTGKNFGCYKTKAEAEKRLDQISKFKDKANIELKEFQDMTIEEFTNLNLKELAGFNLKQVKAEILSLIQKDEFSDLKATTEQMLSDGLLSDSEIETLRDTLYEGFAKNKRLVEIENNLRENIDFKDRINEGKVVLEASKRPEAIARTETVRLTNEGLLESYKNNQIEEVRWLASISDRTCELCESEDGRVYRIEESYGKIPKHVNCRCVWLGVT